MDDNNKILTAYNDAQKNYSSKKRMLRDISKYIKLKHIARKVKKYFAVWKNTPRDYISIRFIKINIKMEIVF